MKKTNLDFVFNDKLGFAFFIGSIVSYFLLTLPLDFSVLCSNVNEGYYFINGQLLLNGKHLYTDIFISRGPLFFLVYAAILKVFGFGAWSIIAIHILQRIVIILTGIILYLVAKKLFHNIFFAGLSVLLWFLLQFIPIGGWGGYYELQSAFALEAEYFCMLFSLLSLYFLFDSFNGKDQSLYSLIAGLFSTCSMLFKANGAILTIAFFCWVIYLFLFQNKAFKNFKNIFVFFSIGSLLSFLIALIAIYIHNHDLASFWYGYFFAGGYYNEKFLSMKSILLTTLDFMSKNNSSASDFFLFLIAFLSFVWGLLRNCFLKTSNNYFDCFYPLISIWGVGNVCSVLATGHYGSYYYIVVWPSAIISLILMLYDITQVRKTNGKFLQIATLIFLSVFFIYRFWVLIPDYTEFTRINSTLNLFSQPESFQDPVPLFTNKCRPQSLLIADVVNNYLPNKEDKFYILNFVKGHQDFSADIYIYAKRLCASSIISDWLFVQNSLNTTLKILVRDLNRDPPKIILLPRKGYLQDWQIKALAQFFLDLTSFLKNNYHLKDSFNYPFVEEGESQIIDVYERN